MRTIAGIPSPKVYAWNACAAGNPVGAEYIIMEKSDGVLLSSKWPTMSMKEKHQLTQCIIGFERSLLSHHFENIGSLYYETDLARSQDKFSTTAYSGFVVGPTTDRKFLEDGRRNFDSDKGPCRYSPYFPYLICFSAFRSF